VSYGPSATPTTHRVVHVARPGTRTACRNVAPLVAGSRSPTTRIRDRCGEDEHEGHRVLVVLERDPLAFVDAALLDLEEVGEVGLHLEVDGHPGRHRAQQSRHSASWSHLSTPASGHDDLPSFSKESDSSVGCADADLILSCNVLDRRERGARLQSPTTNRSLEVSRDPPVGVGGTVVGRRRQCSETWRSVSVRVNGFR
jgi:hypothetical protein